MTHQDLDKLAEETFPGSSPDAWKHQVGYEAGFKKALELVCEQANELQQFRGQLFTVEDIMSELK